MDRADHQNSLLFDTLDRYKPHCRPCDKRLDQAASIAKAAQVCADSGNVGQAVEIVLDVEQLTYESANLLNAASTLNRISQEQA